ncbi:MAG: hypothetical protein H6742_09750 [Alphaproteobacteria bacterium]|nr:hypothetical protein [Alphaproteobacteria bacterium]
MSDAPSPRPRPSAAFRAGMAVERRAAKALRLAAARRGPAVVVEPIRLRSTVGYQLQAWIHRPADPAAFGGDPLPGVVLCPGIDDGGDVFDSLLAPISADEVARLGCVALRFDPAGRGDSWGEEDYGGPEHQDDVATCVRALQQRADVAADQVGIVCVSMGVAMGVGAAAMPDLDVAWLIDWEGPCDREIITAGGARMAPAAGHTLDDEVYWVPREAVRHLPQLRCPYVRLQAGVDHAQPGEFRHATRMLHAAADGQRDGALPWFQINDHPRNVAPPRPQWLRAGTLSAHRAITRKLRVLTRAG